MKNEFDSTHGKELDRVIGQDTKYLSLGKLPFTYHAEVKLAGILTFSLAISCLTLSARLTMNRFSGS